MSLIHWWPLNENLRDIVGGNTLVLTNSTGYLVESDEGKFGGCWEKTKINTADRLRATNKVPAMSEQSIAAWVYVTALANTNTANGLITHHDHNTKTGFGITLKAVSASDARLSCNTGNGSSRTYHSYYGTTNLLNAWHHVCATYDATTIKLYVDGVCEKTVSYTMASKEDYFDLFAWSIPYSSATYRPAAKMCDVRVYDHTLSVAEVKELARAKVLHYTFDDDLACGTTNEAPVSGWSTYGSYWTLLEKTDNGLRIQRPSGSKSTTVAIQNNSLKAKFAQNDIWTFSCYLYKNGQPYKSSCSEISSPTSYYYKTQSWESREDGYYRNTFKITGTPGTWMLHNSFFGTDAEIGVEYEMRYIQFEKREFATPYVSTSRGRFLANEAGYTCTNSANDVTFTENSRIGQRAIYCKDGLQRISATVPYLAADVLSTSLWFKSSNTNPKDRYHILLAVDSGRVEISIPDDGQLRFGGYNKTASNRFCDNYGESVLDGNWHLINTVFDGLTWKGYVDGVLKGTITVTSTKGDSPIVYSNKKLTIGRYHDNTTSYYGATDAYIDDVRIYNSVLTENDIKSIYNIGMYITRGGDFITNNFVERSGGNMVAASDWLQEGIQDANGVSAGTMANRLATKYIPVLPSTEYYYAANSGINIRVAHYYTKELTWIGSDQLTKNSFTAATPDNCAYVRFVIQYSTASNNIPIANINTYGVTMRPAQFNEQLPLTTKTEVRVNKNQVFTCLDVCEGHLPQFLRNGKATARQIIER